MEEIKKISKKANKDEKRNFKIIEIYSKIVCHFMNLLKT